jgi:hypothetical protein
MLRRAFSLVFSPNREWAAICAEPSRPLALLLGYVLPMSAVPALGWMAGLRLFGLDLVREGEVATYPAWPVVLHAGAVTYLASVALLACAFRLIAPAYAAGRDLGRAWTVAAYGSTPLWLFGIVLVKPSLVIGAVGATLHCAYLYYAGLQAVGLVREGDAAEYTAIALLLVVVASTFAGGLLASLHFI